MGQGFSPETDTTIRFANVSFACTKQNEPTKPRRKKFRPTKGAFGKQVK